MSVTLVDLALDGWYTTLVRSEPALDDLAPGRPLPHLAPAVRRITDDLWVGPDPMEAGQECGEYLAARRFEAIGEWLAGEPRLRRVHLDRLPGEPHPVRATPEAVRAEPGTWVEVAGMLPGNTYRVGTLGDVLVIFDIERSRVRVAASPRDREAVKAELARRSW